MFSTSLYQIYYDIYELVKLGFSAEYVESVSPAERGVLKACYNIEKSNKEFYKNKTAMEAVGLKPEDLL